jgi:hypothetical protein
MSSPHPDPPPPGGSEPEKTRSNEPQGRTGPEISEPSRPPVREALLIAGVGLFVVGGLVAWVASPAGSSSRGSAAGNGLDGGYVGSRACGECHPGQHATYVGSGHSHTLTAAAAQRTAQSLAGRSVADPDDPDVRWSYALDGNRFRVERSDGDRVERLLIDYAFGSGTHATTFVSLVDPDPKHPKALEHRLTYFTARGAFGITPGQGEGHVHGTPPRGYELSSREALKCFKCHTTRTSAEGDSTLDVAAMIPNVSCERCHGPGRDHVAAARRGASGLSMPLGPGRWTADSLLVVCGACHRDPTKAPPGLIQPENRQLARFQPVGLSQSRCFRESRGALSCINCHDPHARARADRGRAEAACVHCHGQAPRPACSTPSGGSCVACHMPGVDSGQGILFTDHWIRVRREVVGAASSLSPSAGRGPG